MTRNITIAVTETINAFKDMPERIEDLPRLEGRLEEVRKANVDHNLRLIEKAVAKGASIVGLGELCVGPYFAASKDPVWLAMAESADPEHGASVRELSQAAQRLGVGIIAPIFEYDAAMKQRFNTAVVIDDAGRVLGKYRKTHIPEGKNERGGFDEPFYFGPAAGAASFFPVFEMLGVKVGVSICYDRHFDGVIRSLAANGAELIFSPAVTFGAKSERMWEMEFEVDAARHNVFIAGSNRKGSEAPWNKEFFGRSYVVGPNGRVEADRSVPGLVISTIDADVLTTPDPSGWKLVRDRRPGIYEP